MASIFFTVNHIPKAMKSKNISQSTRPLGYFSEMAKHHERIKYGPSSSTRSVKDFPASFTSLISFTPRKSVVPFYDLGNALMCDTYNHEEKLFFNLNF